MDSCAQRSSFRSKRSSEKSDGMKSHRIETKRGVETEQGTDDLATVIARRKTALTVPELAKMLSVSKETMYRMIRESRLRVYRIGTAIRLDPKTTAEWLRQKSL